MNRLNLNPWRPAFIPQVFRMGQAPAVTPGEVTSEQVSKWRTNGAIGGVARAGVSGLASWSGFYMGRKASGFPSVAGWGIGIIMGLNTLFDVTDAVFSVVAPKETAERWTRMAQAQADAIATELLR